MNCTPEQTLREELPSGHGIDLWLDSLSRKARRYPQIEARNKNRPKSEKRARQLKRKNTKRNRK